MSEELTAERVQELISRAPYHQWLGLKVVAVHEDGIELTAAWREEWVVNPERRYTHGGVLAALIDLAADWAMVRRTGRGVPTVDLRIDYHAAAAPGDLTVRGKVILFSSHELETVERVSSRVVILHRGKVVADDSIENLRNLMALPTLEKIFSQLAVEQDTGAMSRDIADLIQT